MLINLSQDLRKCLLLEGNNGTNRTNGTNGTNGLMSNYAIGRYALFCPTGAVLFKRLQF